MYTYWHHCNMFTYCNEYKKMILLACKCVRTILLRDKPYTVGRCGSIVTKSPYKKHGHLPCLSGRCIGRSKRACKQWPERLVKSADTTPTPPSRVKVLSSYCQGETLYSCLVPPETHIKTLKSRLLHEACLEEKIF
jgi:hypothetical protein